MAGINQIQNERAQRPVNSGPSNNLFLKNGDIAFLHFIGTGNDDDPYIEVFLAHELPPRGEQQWPTPTYCPVLSQHDESYPCPNCGGGYKTKERMRMWFYVYTILHKTLREGEQLQAVNFGGQTYYKRDVNRPLVWDNSAWRESILDEVIFQYSTLGNLRNTQFTLRATGEGKDRRYKLTPVSNTGQFDDNLLNDFRNDVKPIRELLLAEIKPVEVVHRPESGVVEEFNPVAAAPTFAPAGSAPQTDPALLASAPPPDFNPGQPAAPAAPQPPATAEPPAPFEPTLVGAKPTF